MLKGFSKLFRILPVFLSGCLVWLPAKGQEGSENPQTHSLIGDEDARLASIRNIRRNWELEGVSGAIESGFFGIAATLIDRLLEDSPSREERQQLLNHRIHVQLVMGNLAGAASAYEELQTNSQTVDPLLEAMYLFFSDRFQEVDAILSEIDFEELNEADRSWYRLLEALLLTHAGATEQANEAYLLAERTAPTAMLRDHIEIIRLREDVKLGVHTEDTISALRESVRSMRGERGGFEAARLLALALNQSGARDEAIETLNQHLAMPGLKGYGFRPDFLLLLGTISGPDSARGKLALRQLISESEGNQNLEVALSLLAQASSTESERAAFLEDLNNWLETTPPHPLTDRLLAYQAYLLVDKGAFSEAEASALSLLNQFPNSTFTITALRLLAYISWNQTPPRYRTAADYLNQLRQRLPPGREALTIGILIADCYFLNEDYTSASDAYGAVLNDAPPDLAPTIFFQRILSEIGAGLPDVAARYIDEAYRDARIGMESRWKAEWNLLDYLRRNEQVQKAFDRINQVLSVQEADPALPAELVLRMEWISARLSLEAGLPEEAVEKASNLMLSLAEGAYDPLGQELVSEVESHLLLLVGEAHITLGDKPRGLESFSILRERFPRSGPSILSYLVESRAESVDDKLVNAQLSLVSLVDRFPDSEYAPIALWEAALNAEQRGLNIHLRDAISILERLATEYPGHGLVYFARLKQGDLARRLNDFPTALLLYESVLNEYPGHPEQYRAEISRADCLMALGSEDPSRYDVAAVIYQRNCLQSGAPLPIRMEAGYKWARSLRQQGDLQGCEVVLWLLYEQFILDADLNQPIQSEEAGRYWIARSLLDLGDLQTDKGEISSAVQIYETLLRLNLPGAALTYTKLEALR